MRNRWGIEIKKGYHAWAHHPRGGMIDGKVRMIEREPGRGHVVVLDSGYSVSADDVSQVLPPMKVGKGGVVKANPVTEARELFLWAQNDNFIYGKVKRAVQGELSWQQVADFAAKEYAEWEAGDRKMWNTIFTTDDRKVVASMLREWASESGDFAELRGNPTPRLTRYDQPSQRARISEKTGRPTKTASARLKKRRVATHYNKTPGVWANPLTRVKLKTPSMATGDDPSDRLISRRRKTAKAPAGFYANPTGGFLYVVHRADANGKPAYMMAAFRKKSEAIEAAKQYANGSGTPYVIEKKPL